MATPRTLPSITILTNFFSMNWDTFLTKFINDFGYSEKHGETIKAFFPSKDRRRTYSEVIAITNEVEATLKSRVKKICSNKELDLESDAHTLDNLHVKLVEKYYLYCQDLPPLQVIEDDIFPVDMDEFLKAVGKRLKAEGIIHLKEEVRAVVKRGTEFNYSSHQILKEVLGIICPELSAIVRSSSTNARAEENSSTVSYNDEDLELAHWMTVKILELRFKCKLVDAKQTLFNKNAN
jgi:hypothetical protein